LQDLGSILTFLQICRPLDNEDFYKRLVLRPLKDGDPSGAELLRVRGSHSGIPDITDLFGRRL
jgi:SWI/SNF-related matrix-associated actin-dependent regulator of chromatin subfamily A3